MAENPLRSAVKSGNQFAETLRGLFARIGSSQYPNGIVPAAYRNARRGMTAALAERNPRRAAAEITAELKSVILNSLGAVFDAATVNGAREASKQLKFYGISAAVTRADVQELTAAVDPVVYPVIESRLDAQISSIDAILAGGIYHDLILGDGTRLGILRPGEIQSAAAFWTAALAWDGFSNFTRRKSTQPNFGKQAVAALDRRTTNCCLEVHGQVVDLDKPFHLIGTPRYADEIDWPPFHDYCRTSGILYLPEYDDGLTAELKSSAQTVLAERAAGVNVDRSPADAFS